MLDRTIPSSQNPALNAVSGLQMTNDTGQVLTGNLFFDTSHSSFDPLSSLGTGVDNLSIQSASFSTLVFGPGVGSENSCTMGAGPATGCILLSGPSIGGFQYTEAVWSADSSQDYTGIGLSLAPGASEQLSYTISSGADFQVPEPSSMVLLTSGPLLFAPLLFRRRRASATGAAAALCREACRYPCRRLAWSGAVFA